MFQLRTTIGDRSYHFVTEVIFTKPQSSGTILVQSGSSGGGLPSGRPALTRRALSILGRISCRIWLIAGNLHLPRSSLHRRSREPCVPGSLCASNVVAGMVR